MGTPVNRRTYLTHCESLALALCRGAPRTSTLIGGDGMGGRGPTWQRQSTASEGLCGVMGMVG